jgi:hypothetical protein
MATASVSSNNSNSLPSFSVFHQKEDITTRIKNILDEYPPGMIIIIINGQFHHFELRQDFLQLFYNVT